MPVFEFLEATADPSTPLRSAQDDIAYGENTARCNWHRGWMVADGEASADACARFAPEVCADLCQAPADLALLAHSAR